MRGLLKKIFIISLSLIGFTVQSAEEEKKIGPIKIVIESNDLMKFDKSSINVEKGNVRFFFQKTY